MTAITGFGGLLYDLSYTISSYLMSLSASWASSNSGIAALRNSSASFC